MKIFIGPTPSLLYKYISNKEYIIFSSLIELIKGEKKIKFRKFQDIIIGLFYSFKLTLPIYIRLRILLSMYDIKEIIFYKVGFEKEIFKIAKDFPNIKFKFVLQSLMFDKMSKRLEVIPHPNYNIDFFVMTESDKLKLVSMGFNDGKITQIGSVPVLLMKLVKDIEIKYDVCIISQVQDKWFMNDETSIKNTEQLRIAYLNFLESINIATENLPLKIAIQLRPQSTGTKYLKNEKEVFSNILKGKDIYFIENDFDNLTNYKTILSSRLIVGLFSTMLIEAVFMGKKTLTFDYYKTNAVDFSTFPYVINDKNNQKEIVDIFNSILHMDIDTYFSNQTISLYKNESQLEDIFSRGINK